MVQSTLRCHRCDAPDAAVVKSSAICTMALAWAGYVVADNYFELYVNGKLVGVFPTALLKTRHQNLPLRDRTLEFHVRGQFPHAETRSLWTKRRPIAAFRARPDSVCVRHGLAGWGGGIRTSAY